MGFIGALISSIGFALANVATKKALLKTPIPQTLLFMTFSGILSLFLLIIFFPFAGDELNAEFIKWALVLGVSDFLTYVIMYKAFKAGDVSIAAGLLCLYPLISIFITTVFFKEALSLGKFLLILIILAGGIVTSIDWKTITKSNKKINFAKGMIWIILGIIAYGIYYPVLGTFTATGSWVLKLYGIKIISLICIIISAKLILKKSLSPKNKKIIAIPLLIGLFEIIGWAGFAWASNNTTGQIGVIVVLLNMVTVFTAIGAIVILKERLHKLQYLGILITTIGLIWLSL